MINHAEKVLAEVRNNFSILPLYDDASVLFARLKQFYRDTHGLSKDQMKKHNIDFLIAATAIRTDSVLVSTDSIYSVLMKAEPDLRVENWLLPV